MLSPQKNQSISGQIDWLAAPLYLHKREGNIYTSHALNDLFGNKFPLQELCRRKVQDYIKNGPALDNQCIFHNTVMVPPGSSIEILEDRTIKIRRLPPTQHKPPEAAFLEELLCDEIKLSLTQLAYKRVCFALSGGVDSTLLVLLSKHRKMLDSITCYTADTEAGKDLTYAQAVARALNVDLKVVTIHRDIKALTEQRKLSKAKRPETQSLSSVIRLVFH